MVAIAYPNIIEWIPKYRLRSDRMKIITSFQMAKMKAIATNSNLYIDFDHDDDGSTNEQVLSAFLDTDDSTYGEFNNSKGENEFNLSQIQTFETMDGIPVIKLSSGITFGVGANVIRDINGTSINPADFSGITFPNDEAIFYPNGRSTPGEVYIKNSNDETFGLKLFITGLPKVYKWNGTDWQS
jgi:hypothetical protein